MSGTTNIGGKGPAGDISFNYIPLIDVTFNLIIFFVLTSEISTSSRAKVIVPMPIQSQVQPREGLPGKSVIISVVSDNKDELGIASSALRYEIEGQQIPLGEPAMLLLAIQKQKAFIEKNPSVNIRGKDNEFYAEIRADKRVSFGYVRPVMEAVTKAGIFKMGITAKQDLKENMPKG